MASSRKPRSSPRKPEDVSQPARGSLGGDGFSRRVSDAKPRGALAPEAAPRKSGAAKKKSPPSKIQSADASSPISFGPEICADLAAAEQREWLVTNGIGGFASGTVAGSATRRYHGLLFAALNPPASRTLLVTTLDEILHAGQLTYELATHRWFSGAVAPEGYKFIQNFRLEGTVPVWTFQLGSARLEKRIWMQHGENTTFIHYTLLESGSPIELELKALVNYRDFHASTHAGSYPNEWRMRVDPVPNGLRITAYDGATPFYLKSASAECEPQHIWYRDFFFPLERERGLDDHEDQLFGAAFHVRLEKGQSATIVSSTNPNAPLDGNSALEAERDRQSKILAAATSSSFTSSTSFTSLTSLLLAADQFLVSRPLPGQADGKSIIAGYHWFCDWGRDTMIALPGLTLATSRPEIAREILLAFSRYVDRGMLPNNFPDSAGAPEYNTIDATLWYFEAIRQYFAATRDTATLKKLFPVLQQIIAAHREGTRYNIHVDPADGLVYGGGPGAQLTWMDAKIGDWVVTPRTGKPVEINALWINALETMVGFAKEIGSDHTGYAQLAATATANFARFWNPARNCCFDVIDSPVRSSDVAARYIEPSSSPSSSGSDVSLRPNQIFAVSLPVSPLSPEQRRAVVDACAAHLLTPYGLRSLAPGESGYTGVYSGGPRERDAAYHQGTVWPWLLGPFVLAHYRVYQDRKAALAFLEPLATFLTSGGLSPNGGGSYGVGSLPEIFDGDLPHRPRGCIAQAWSVAELLRAFAAFSS